jgi:hypothetical protein
MIRAKPRNPTARIYSKHGLNTLRNSLRYSGNALTSRRYKVGRVLWEWRQELVRDVGGEAAISTQQLAVIDLAVKTKLLLDSNSWRSFLRRARSYILVAGCTVTGSC